MWAGYILQSVECLPYKHKPWDSVSRHGDLLPLPVILKLAGEGQKDQEFKGIPSYILSSRPVWTKDLSQKSTKTKPVLQLVKWLDINATGSLSRIGFSLQSSQCKERIHSHRLCSDHYMVRVYLSSDQTKTNFGGNREKKPRRNAVVTQK